MASAYETFARAHGDDEIADIVGVKVATVKTWHRNGVPERIEDFFRSYLSDLGTAPFTFVDLFAGIGGTRLGFERVGGRCVFTSEWNVRSRETYTENYWDGAFHEFAGDITAVAAAEIPDHDVLVAGFPCQPFSIAGVSKKRSLGCPTGFEDKTQGTLFFDVARILDEKRPRAFLLENVRNLQSHDEGRTFQTILETLVEKLGYHVEYRVIGAEPWVPQKRRRIFIVGFREDVGFSFDDMTIPDSSPRMDAVLHPEDGSEEAEAPYTQGLLAAVAPKYTLTDHLWTYLRNYAAKHRKAGNGFGYGLVGPGDVARTLSARYHKDGSEILIDQPGKNPRRLTPRECARLMGYPENFRIPVSDAVAYRQFGNSVVVPLVESIATVMRARLEE